MRYKSHHKKATTAPTTVLLEESIKSRTFEVGANTNSSVRAGRNGTSPTLTSIFGIFTSQIGHQNGAVVLSLRGVSLSLAAHTVSPEVRRLNVGNGQKLSLLEKKKKLRWCRF